LPDSLRCKQRHAHATAARRDSCDARYFDRRGYEKLEEIQFAPPPRLLIEEFPGIPALIDDKLAVVVFTAEQILPHGTED
jgi:hypothetical protein